MQVNWLDSGLGQIATTAIGGYQKYISPHKGFSCAHRLLHGGESCSQYVKGAIAENGLFGAIEASRQRFSACKTANQMLRARYSKMSAEDDESNPQRKQDTTSNCDPILNSCSYCSVLDFSSADCTHCGSALDCSAIDCGSVDVCSGLDCGAIDCGGCSW